MAVPMLRSGIGIVTMVVVVLGVIVIAIILLWPKPLPPATEEEALRAAIRHYLLPLDAVTTMGRQSQCRSRGQTSAGVPGDLFGAFLKVNDVLAEAIDWSALSLHLSREHAGASPEQLSQRLRTPVVSLSRAGVVGNRALACIEIFGAEQRGFFVVLERSRAGGNGKGKWRALSEHEAWASDQPMPWQRDPDDPMSSPRQPEELPDGTPYKP